MVKWVVTTVVLMVVVTMVGVGALPPAVADASTTPGPSTTIPGISTTSPDPSTTTPGNSTTTPGNSTTFPDPSSTSPGISTTSPDPSTTSRGPSTTSPGPSTTSPGSSTTSPGSSTTIAGSSTTITGSSLNTTDPKTEPEPEPGTGATSQESGESTTPATERQVMTLTPECKAQMEECTTLMTPGPLAPPSADAACSASPDTNCITKFNTCKLLQPRPISNRTSTNKRMCVGVATPGCEARAQACRELLHPSPAFHQHKLDCMTHISGCPLEPRSDPEARDAMKQCVEPMLMADLEAINNTMLRKELLDSFNSCFENNEIPGAMTCLTKSCISVIVL